MHDQDIPYGVPVTINPKRRYVAGRWLESEEYATLVWDKRLEEAHDDGQFAVVSVGEVDGVGDLKISEYQDIKFLPDSGGKHPDAAPGLFRYDPQTETLELRPHIKMPAASVTDAPTADGDIARKAEIDAIQSNLDTHGGDTTNPHDVDYSQTGAASSTALTDHEGDTTNPHSVDYSQTGAAPSGHDNTEHSTNYAAETALSNHETNTNNPHDTVLADVHAPQRGAPSTTELASGDRMLYTSDGSDSHSAGDLVSARNDAGAIVSQVVAAAVDDA